ncbi:MAG: hypothetical protein M1834_009170 [Cirrosporium novae-zelandiae]|nr:MAG: hypothetical protein M1834_009170 [Cirrosporium novae-zelandiae]
MPHHILVLGATGPAGLEFCSQALAKCHSLTLYIRNPSKLPADISENSSVTIFKGELTDKEALERAVSNGADTAASFLGPIVGHKGTPIADGYKLLLPLLKKYRVYRGLFLSTVSWRSPDDNWSWYSKWRLLVLFVKVINIDAYQEINAMTPIIACTSERDLKWTIFRVPILNNNEVEKEVGANFVGSSEEGMFLSRKGMARWVLKEIDEEKWVGKGPCIWD